MSTQVGDQEIDWQKWESLEIDNEISFRDEYLLIQDYHENFDELLDGLYAVVD